MATSSTLSASAAITTSTATPGQTTQEPNKLLTSTAAPETTTQMPSNAAPTTTPAATTMAAASACDGPGGLEVSQRMNLDEGRLQYLCRFLFLSSSSSLPPAHSLAVIPRLVSPPPSVLVYTQARESAHARERERARGREGGREGERESWSSRPLLVSHARMPRPCTCACTVPCKGAFGRICTEQPHAGLGRLVTAPADMCTCDCRPPGISLLQQLTVRVVSGDGLG